jgi:Flp pilus assembly pilin Flp
MQQFVVDEEGVSLIEYALLCTFIALIGLAGLSDIAGALVAKLFEAAAALA